MIPNTTWNSVKADEVLDHSNNWFTTFDSAENQTLASYEIKAIAFNDGGIGISNSGNKTISLSNDMLENDWKTFSFTLDIQYPPGDNIVHFHLFNGISFGRWPPKDAPFKDRLKPLPTPPIWKQKNIGPIVLYDDFSAKVVGEQLTEISQKGFQVQMSNEEFIKFTTGSGLEIKSELGSVGVDLLEPKNLLFNSSQSYHNPTIGFNTVASQSLVPSTLTLQGQAPLPASGSNRRDGGYSGDVIIKTLDGAPPTGSGDGGNAGNILLKPGTGGLKYSCFVAGTKIETDMGTTFIEEIREGDNVKSFDFETNSVVTSKVKKTFIHYNKNYIIINGIIKTTIEHRFYSNNEWVHAGNLSIGDKILQIDGSKLIVETIESNDELETVYNFHVERTQNYFAEGCLVHNAKGNVDGADGEVRISSKVHIEGGAGVTGSLQVSGSSIENSYPLEVAGYHASNDISIYAEKDVAAYSDIRKKTDINTITGSLDIINNIRGITFRDKVGNGNRRMGVIAQELEPYLPEIVSTDGSGFKSVKYANLTALLIQAVKEQQEQIEDLKQQVKEIKDAKHW
jgi:hypothetical protein